MEQIQKATTTYKAHNCFDHTQEIWTNQKDSSYTECSYCHRITRFRYKSFWRRLKTAFIRELI